jgi:urease accessory protein
MFDATPLPDRVDDFSPVDWPDVGARNPSDKDLQRAEGSGRIVLSGSDKATRVMGVFQRSPIRIMFPRTADDALEEAVLVNTAGGIAGGDRLETDVTALGNASTGRRKGLSGLGRTSAHHDTAESLRGRKTRMAAARNDCV